MNIYSYVLSLLSAYLLGSITIICNIYPEYDTISFNKSEIIPLLQKNNITII